MRRTGKGFCQFILGLGIILIGGLGISQSEASPLGLLNPPAKTHHKPKPNPTKPKPVKKPKPEIEASEPGFPYPAILVDKKGNWPAVDVTNSGYFQTLIPFIGLWQ